MASKQDTIEVHLQVIAGPHQGELFKLAGPRTFVVGRSEQADVSLLRDADVPTVAFVVEVRNQEVVIHAVGTVDANGSLLRTKEIVGGETISVGRSIIKLGMNRVRQSHLPEDSFATIPDRHQTGPSPSSGTDDISDTLISPPGYVLGKVLGRGQMGTVYLATREQTHELFAIKAAHIDIFDDPKKIQLFLREASILSQLYHKRIIRFYEVSSVAHRLFIVMEYVPTVDLKAFFSKLPTRKRIRTAVLLTCQILEGLVYAHERGLVHRDIKPSNILAVFQDQKLSCKLADFGLAKSFMDSGASGITDSGELRGTLGYMAPEQLQHAKSAGPAADIYSTAATLFYLLTGHHPIERATRSDIIVAILEETATPLDSYLPEAPQALGRILAKGMAKRPDERFETARQFRQSLRKILERKPS